MTCATTSSSNSARRHGDQPLPGVSVSDWLGRRTAAADPDSGTSTYEYDVAGRLSWSIDARNQKISYSYDDLGRQTTHWAG
jgi:YD repeat-containing protein